ncbi:MAG: helix-turn-helix domain-containing protein [Romboutsia sp.]
MSIIKIQNRINDIIKTTLDERIEIVGFCIANNFNYELTSNKYNISYNQIYTWVKKYKQNGYEGLEDRRGKAKSLESMDKNLIYLFIL